MFQAFECCWKCLLSGLNVSYSCWVSARHQLVLLLLLLLLLLIVITFMQGIYSYIPETNHVSRVFSVTAILYLQFMLNVMLYPMLNVLYIYISTSRSMCAVPSMAVLCSSLHLVLSQYVA